MPLSEICNADPLVIHTIQFELGNQNGGRTEKLRGIFWGNEKIWQGNTNADQFVLDRPIRMGPRDAGEFRFVFSKDATLDVLAVRFIYDIGQGAGDCTKTVDGLVSKQ